MLNILERLLDQQTMVHLGIMRQLIIQLQIISMESPSQNNHQLLRSLFWFMFPYRNQN